MTSVIHNSLDKYQVTAFRIQLISAATLLITCIAFTTLFCLHIRGIYIPASQTLLITLASSGGTAFIVFVLASCTNYLAIRQKKRRDEAKGDKPSENPPSLISRHLSSHDQVSKHSSSEQSSHSQILKKKTGDLSTEQMIPVTHISRDHHASKEFQKTIFFQLEEKQDDGCSVKSYSNNCSEKEQMPANPLVEQITQCQFEKESLTLNDMTDQVSNAHKDILDHSVSEKEDSSTVESIDAERADEEDSLDTSSSAYKDIEQTNASLKSKSSSFSEVEESTFRNENDDINNKTEKKLTKNEMTASEESEQSTSETDESYPEIDPKFSTKESKLLKDLISDPLNFLQSLLHCLKDPLQSLLIFYKQFDKTQKSSVDLLFQQTKILSTLPFNQKDVFSWVMECFELHPQLELVQRRMIAAYNSKNVAKIREMRQESKIISRSDDPASIIRALKKYTDQDLLKKLPHLLKPQFILPSSELKHFAFNFLKFMFKKVGDLPAVKTAIAKLRKMGHRLNAANITHFLMSVFTEVEMTQDELDKWQHELIQCILAPSCKKMVASILREIACYLHMIKLLLDIKIDSKCFTDKTVKPKEMIEKILKQELSMMEQEFLFFESYDCLSTLCSELRKDIFQCQSQWNIHRDYNDKITFLILKSDDKRNYSQIIQDKDIKYCFRYIDHKIFKSLSRAGDDNGGDLENINSSPEVKKINNKHNVRLMAVPISLEEPGGFLEDFIQLEKLCYENIPTNWLKIKALKFSFKVAVAASDTFKNQLQSFLAEEDIDEEHIQQLLVIAKALIPFTEFLCDAFGNTKRRVELRAIFSKEIDKCVQSLHDVSSKNDLKYDELLTVFHTTLNSVQKVFDKKL